MEWEKAKEEIKKKVKVDTDVNTERSNKSGCRVVIRVCDWGYKIPKGKNSNMKVTWDMLEKCWNRMVYNGGVYDPNEFKKLYPNYARNAGCYVHTIRRIFEEAGLA